MAVSPQGPPDGQSTNREDYEQSFVRKVLLVVDRGHAILEQHEFSNRMEEEITGELTRAMQQQLQSDDAPAWCKWFWVYEEARINDRIRTGKRRFRIDIEIIECRRGLRPRFRFEAKRLRSRASINAFLGKSGLGCFLNGSYAAEDKAAGMLAYVQARTIQEQSADVAAAMAHRAKALAVQEEGDWRQEQGIPNLPTFRSSHHRPHPLGPITIFHAFLLFRDPAI